MLKHMFRSVFFVCAVAAAGAQAPPQPIAEALDGVDPVILLTQGKEIQGKPAFKVTRGKFEYLFATAESQAIFEKAPEKYEIQLNGMCARMGSARGNPSDYAVVDGKIYVFGSDDCHKKFVAAPAKFLPKPAPPMPSSAADAQRGRALLDRAVASLGGAQRLDSLTSYVEAATQKQARPQGEATIAQKTMWRFPDAVRTLRTLTLGERTQVGGNLLTPAGGWYITADRVYPAPPDGLADAQTEAWRQVVP